MINQILFRTNVQKILQFLLSHANEEFYDREISRLTGVSKAGTNFALRDLSEAGVVTKEKRGRMCFYRLDAGDVLIKQLKIVQNIVSLEKLVRELKPLSLKITLYGSASKGDNTEESDVDLFILTREPEHVKKILFGSNLREKIQYVVNTPQEFARSKKESPVFHQEIRDGLTLWKQT